MALDISDFDKDQLAEYALTTFNVQLTMTKSLEKLKAEVLLLQVQPEAKSDPEPTRNAKATHIKNLTTGHVFPWTALLKKHLAEEGAACTEDGELV